MKNAKRLWLLAAALLATAPVACRQEGPVISGLPDFPIDTTGILGPVTGSSTLQQRMTALDQLQSVVNGLPVGKFAGNTTLLVQTMKAMPQFATAGAAPDGTVWGIFKGGIAVYIVAGGTPGTPSSDVANTVGVRSASIPPRAMAPGFASRTFAPPPRPSASLQQAAGGNVPASERYHLLNGLGSVFSGSDPRSDLASMLNSNGYSGTQGDATVAALRSISGDGVFYLRTHGGMGSIHADVSTADTYALWTASEALDSTAEKADALLTDDLKQGRVVYMLFRNDRWSQAFPSIFEKSRHYGITEDFVEQYMSFSENSFVYLDACRGAAQPTLISAFHGKGASVVAGWTENAVILQLGPTAKYVFDRLLGANVFVPENPKQRPFEFGELLIDPKFGTGKTYGYTSATASDGTPVNASLVFDSQGSGFQMLAPTILNVTADEADDQLFVAGDFGDNPGADGKVTINDGSGEVALAVVEWKPDHIATDLKRTGPGSAGNVVVTVRGHHSNTRQLLAWSGTMHYTMHEVGSLTQVFDLDFQARADPLEVRLQIAAAPIMPVPPAFATTKGEQVRYASSGTYTSPQGQCTLTTDWAGESSFTSAIGPQASGKSYTYAGFVDRQAKIFTMGIGATDPTGLAIQQTFKCPMSTNVSNTQDLVDFDLGKGGLASGSSPTLKLALDDALVIGANSRTGSAASHFDQNAKASFTLQWSAISPHPSFNPDVPR